jgi:hypothetical protein
MLRPDTLLFDDGPGDDAGHELAARGGPSREFPVASVRQQDRPQHRQMGKEGSRQRVEGQSPFGTLDECNAAQEEGKNRLLFAKHHSEFGFHD